MYVIPAIDIMNGRVVRLIKGDPGKIKSYEYLGDPLSLAKRWRLEGASLIHVVDIDAALGRGENIGIIEEIVKSIKIPIQVGGGVRSIDKAIHLLDMGIERIVLGSLAFRSPNTVSQLLNDFGWRRIAVALDHLDGEVMINGWRTSTHKTLKEAIQKFLTIGVRFFLITSIQHDGMMNGPDIKNLSEILNLNANIIVSGGVRNLDDIIALKNLNIYGVIIGRALYEGLLSLREALKAAR
ncbi:MAG: 1-(5-phosphoribosyl)-5-[(5-phosphoribosylamino)methylideneamino]imidazole-4-carboxamide isomerase [Candidatus Methanomethylicia archaeon]